MLSYLSGDSYLIANRAQVQRFHNKLGASMNLGLDSPFFSTIVLFNSQLFPHGFGGFLERRMPEKYGQGTPRMNDPCHGQLQNLADWQGIKSQKN